MAKIESDYRTADANYQSILNQLTSISENLVRLELEIDTIDESSNQLHELKNSLEDEVKELRETTKSTLKIKRKISGSK